jgi:hypothetical protein
MEQESIWGPLLVDTLDKVVFDLGEFPKGEYVERSAAEAATIEAN